MTNSTSPDPSEAKNDLDIYCLQRQGRSGFSMDKINKSLELKARAHLFKASLA